MFSKRPRSTNYIQIETLEVRYVGVVAMAWDLKLKLRANELENGNDTMTSICMMWLPLSLSLSLRRIERPRQKCALGADGRSVSLSSPISNWGTTDMQNDPRHTLLQCYEHKNKNEHELSDENDRDAMCCILLHVVYAQEEWNNIRNWILLTNFLSFSVLFLCVVIFH